MGITTLVAVLITFNCGKFYGLLPLTYAPKPSRLGPQTVEGKKEFRAGRIGGFFSVAQLLLQLWTCYLCIRYLLKCAASRPVALCSQGNFCSIFSVMLSHVVISLLVIIIVPFRYRKTITCFQNVDYLFRNKLYTQRHIPIASAVTTLPLLGVILKIIIGHFGFPIKRLRLYYTYNLAYFGPILLISIINSLCLVAEQVYADINDKLQDLCDRTVPVAGRIERLRMLMQHHWFVSDFVEGISQCFALDILVIMLDIYVQLVLFLYVTFWGIVTRKIFENTIWPHIAGFLEVTIILIKLISFCYRCDRVISRGKSTMFQLQHLSSKMNYDLDFKQTVKIFIMQLNCRKVAITACGFFSINLALLITITGIVLTYFLVLIQFQVDNEVDAETAKVVAKMICTSWPCLESPKNLSLILRAMPKN